MADGRLGSTVTPAETGPVVEVGPLLVVDVSTVIVVVVGRRVVVLESIVEEVESEAAGEHPPTVAATRATTATMRTREVLTKPEFHAATIGDRANRPDLGSAIRRAVRRWRSGVGSTLGLVRPATAIVILVLLALILIAGAFQLRAILVG